MDDSEVELLILKELYGENSAKTSFFFIYLFSGLLGSPNRLAGWPIGRADIAIWGIADLQHIGKAGLALSARWRVGRLVPYRTSVSKPEN